MQDSTSGRRSQGTRKEILPHRAWRFSEHPAGKQVTLYAAKSFTSRSRRIVHSRPKNKAATLFKPEVRELSSGRLPTGHQKVLTKPNPRRPKGNAYAQILRKIQEVTTQAIPRTCKGQESTGKHRRTLRQDIGALKDCEQ